MNKLWVRLTLAFVAVTLVGVTAVALSTDWSAGSRFRDFLMHQAIMGPGGLTDDLSNYYQQNRSWNGVAKIFSDASTPPMMRGMPMMRASPPILLADANGRVVYDELGSRNGSPITADERANAMLVVSNGNTVGYLVVNSSHTGALAPVEQNFLDELRRTLVVAALMASGLGIILGLIISRALTAPLGDVAQAARAFAGRDWSRRVPVRGSDEVALVAREFNAMADSLQRAEVQRRALTADIAHELRTPLTVLQGNLRAMLDDVYPLERQEIATIYDETRLLARLVDDLRELALVEAGQLELKSEPVDLGAVVRAAVANFWAGAEAQKVHLVAAIVETPPVRGDPDRLAQILRNLLTNALRHTPSGGTVTVSVTQDKKWVHVSAEDTGEGIAAEDLPRVFDRFYRGDKSRERASGGSGLGLAIAKSLVEAMGGQIGVKSAQGKGSVFWFTLPII